MIPSTKDATVETNPVKKLFDENGNRVSGFRVAVNAMCATCVGCTVTEQGEGFKDHRQEGFVKEIRHCTVYSCPLHHLRPYQTIDRRKR